MFLAQLSCMQLYKTQDTGAMGWGRGSIHLSAHPISLAASVNLLLATVCSVIQRLSQLQLPTPALVTQVQDKKRQTVVCICFIGYLSVTMSLIYQLSGHVNFQSPISSTSSLLLKCRVGCQSLHPLSPPLKTSVTKEQSQVSCCFYLQLVLGRYRCGTIQW